MGDLIKLPSVVSALIFSTELSSSVLTGDVVCIVEAMKMMNEIKSEFTGKVISIKVDNSEPVEYGQALFEIEE